MQADFVERIYEAAALPELWSGLFEDLATSNGFAGGGMVTLNDRFPRAVITAGMQAAFADYVAGGWGARDLRESRTRASGYQGFLRDTDLLSAAEIETDPMYVELLRPHGLGWSVGSIVSSPNGDDIAFAFERADSAGPSSLETIANLDEIRPHLARAGLFSARIDLERARAQTAALASVGLPAAVLTANGSVVDANPDLVTMIGQTDIGARNALTLRDRAADLLFQDALSRPIDAPPQGRSIPLRSAEDAPAAVLHVLPIRRAARDVFTRSAWLIVVAPLSRGRVPDPTILSGLYDLSPAEARVAAKIIEGETVASVASGFGVAEATVRTQLRAIFAKTGTERQAEFVALCGRLGSQRL